MSDEPLLYCGRSFSAGEFAAIKQIIAAADRPNRTEIARRVCRELSWFRPNGELKAMSCRVVLLKMHRDGLIELPDPRNGNANGKLVRHLEAPQGEPVLTGPLKELLPLTVTLVQGRAQSQCWNDLMAHHHYLGYVPLPGAQLRYLIYAREGQLLSALGFGAAAWKIADRDKWIGWDAATRSCNLNYIANNNRFLIVPHVQVANLASKILSIISRRISDDWQARYGYNLFVLETFVERDRFRGSCYRAANWRYLGSTQGRGKLDRYEERALPVKEIFVYPLTRNWRNALLQSPSPNRG